MAIFYCVTCHNFEPSLAIIMNDGDQYFEKKIMFKNLYNTTCQKNLNGKQLIMSTCHNGCNYNGVA